MQPQEGLPNHNLYIPTEETRERLKIMVIAMAGAKIYATGDAMASYLEDPSAVEHPAIDALTPKVESADVPADKANLPSGTMRSRLVRASELVTAKPAQSADFAKRQETARQLLGYVSTCVDIADRDLHQDQFPFSFAMLNNVAAATMQFEALKTATGPEALLAFAQTQQEM